MTVSPSSATLPIERREELARASGSRLATGSSSTSSSGCLAEDERERDLRALAPRESRRHADRAGSPSRPRRPRRPASSQPAR